MSFIEFKNKLLRKTTLKRTLFFVIGDILLIGLSCWLAFLLRFDGSIPEEYVGSMITFIAIIVGLTVFVFAIEKLYSISWSFISIKEFIKLIRAIVIVFSIFATGLFLFRHLLFARTFPRSIILIAAFTVLIATGALRFSKRIYYQGFRSSLTANGIRTLVIGAGDAGEQIIRHINQTKNEYSVIGIIDDNPLKHNISIHGVRILGDRTNLAKIINKFSVENIIIAMPSVHSEVIRETVEAARSAGVNKIKILPTTQEILSDKISLTNVRDVSIDDLLGRKKVEIKTDEIESYVKGKTIIVSGAAGSIGSQLCRQILKFSPAHLICLDNNETELFYLNKDLSKDFNNHKLSYIIANICDKHKINHIFTANKPQVVFHAAAYKHVPVMETDPDEAIKNNVLGTLTMGQASIRNGVSKFIMISTDKAINPTSIMGASKRISEMVGVWLNRQDQTKFCAVRFGNVLGSRGSVVPIFKQQIKRGGPIEVTHPEMKRYFMATSEACLLVMQAGALGQGGEVFVLDMGEPIKIVDLARELIKLSGYEPDVDIPIVHTGIRPGEKLFEEILTKTETPTKHDQIFIAKLDEIDEQKLHNHLLTFRIAIKSNDHRKIKNTISKLVPTYTK